MKAVVIFAVVALAMPAFSEARASGRLSPDGASSKSSRSKRIEKTVEVRGRTVSLESRAADVTVVPGQGDQARLVVNLEYWSRNEAWMTAVDEEFDVYVREDGRDIRFEPADMPEKGMMNVLGIKFGGGNVNYSMKISLEVPAGTPLELENRYGDVSVKKVRGELQLSNTSGDVEVADVVGRAEIENKYGDVVIDGVDGDLDVQVGSGTLELESVSGEAEVSIRYGKAKIVGVAEDLVVESSSSELAIERVGGTAEIVGSYAKATVSLVGNLDLEVSSGDVSVKGVKGSAAIACSYGVFEVEGVGEDLELRCSSSEGKIRDVGGLVEVDNSYGDVLLQDIRGGVNVSNSSGGVTLENITGDAEIRSSYEAIRVRGVTGSLEVTASSAAVRAEDIGGGVRISTSYSGVVLSGVGGPVDVRNQSGRVEVRGLSGAALTAMHRVETSYEDIVFTWPESGYPMRFVLESTYGSVSTEFPAITQEKGSRKTAEGSVGAAEGGPLVDLSARSGSITLRRQ